jgi:hypothetical protein
MVYDVQNYEVYFGLYPSSGIYDKKSQRLVQWLRLALSNGPNWVGLSCPIHLRTETDPVSETLWFLSSIYQIMDRVQNKPNSSVQLTPSSQSFQVYQQIFILPKTCKHGWNKITSGRQISAVAMYYAVPIYVLTCVSTDNQSGDCKCIRLDSTAHTTITRQCSIYTTERHCYVVQEWGNTKWRN